MAFAYDPATGLLATSEFPTTPASETEARQQFMTLLDQIKDYLNTYSAEATLTTTGDMVYASSAKTLARLAKGTARQILAMNSGATAPEWIASLQSILTAAGDIIYASSANTPAKLAKGTARQQLAMNSGETAPEWVASLQSILTTQGDIIQASAANTPSRLGIGTAGQILVVNSGATALEYSSGISVNSFPTAGGTGTAITVTDVKYGGNNGDSTTFIAAANNSGAATTIAINGGSALNFYKPGGTDAPTIVSGKAYTGWKSGTSFFLKASAEGTATASKVLETDTFSNDSDTGIQGTMPNNADNDIQSSLTADVSISEGYYNGSGSVLKPLSLAGNNLIYSSDAEAYVSNNPMQKIKEATINIGGAYRIYYEAWCYPGTTSIDTQIYKNGVAIGTIHYYTGSSPLGYTEDISGWNAGDKIQIYAQTAQEEYTGGIRYFRVNVATPFII